MDALGYGLTYPTTCRDCGNPIFFHTNGNGDVVLFDQLGAPWPIHPCYLSRIGRTPSDPAEYRAKMVTLYGSKAAARKSALGSNFSFPQKRAIGGTKRVKTTTEEIARCEPANFLGRSLSIIGFVHALHSGWPLSRFAGAGSLGYAAYRNAIKSDAYCQLTVIDSSLMSYTIVVPGPTLKLPLGAIVSVTIEAVAPIRKAVFLCRSLSVVQISRV